MNRYHQSFPGRRRTLFYITLTVSQSVTRTPTNQRTLSNQRPEPSFRGGVFHNLSVMSSPLGGLRYHFMGENWSIFTSVGNPGRFMVIIRADNDPYTDQPQTSAFLPFSHHSLNHCLLLLPLNVASHWVHFLPTTGCCYWPLVN